MNEEDNADIKSSYNDELLDEEDNIEEDEAEEGDSDDEFKEQVSFELLEPDVDSKLDDEYSEIERFTNAISASFR